MDFINAFKIRRKKSSINLKEVNVAKVVNIVMYLNFIMDMKIIAVF